MRELEAKGWFQLPPPEIHKGPPSPRRLSEPVTEPETVPGEVGEVADWSWILVAQASQMRIWNELMIREHRQGAGPLVGRQVRYLVGSAHGWLGGSGLPHRRCTWPIETTGLVGIPHNDGRICTGWCA